MMMMMMMVLFMDMEKSWCHHWCWIWGAKYIIQKIKLARPFITFAKHLSRWFEWKMKNKIINTNTQTSCTTTEYVKLTTGMYHNIHFQTSNMNILDLPITYCRPIFMAWVFMIIPITCVQFILILNMKERRGQKTLPLASFVG